MIMINIAILKYMYHKGSFLSSMRYQEMEHYPRGNVHWTPRPSASPSSPTTPGYA